MFARWKLAFLLLVTVALIILVILHCPYLNGPTYWKWHWRDPSLPSAWRWYSLMLLASIPTIVGVFWETLPAIRLSLLMLGVVSMKLTSVAIVTTPASFGLLDAIVRSPGATSYYIDAAALAQNQPQGWLAIYPDFLPLANLHTQSKPPGAVAYYFAFIRAFGFDRAAVIAGIVLAVIASISIPLVHWMARLLTQDARIGMIAAVLAALCPGFVLIFPTFDACYLIFSCAMIALWWRAFERNDWRLAVAFGIVLWISTVATYNLLVLGPLLAALPFVRTARLKQFVVFSGIALLTFATLYLLLWLAASFDPIATFRSAWNNQHRLLAEHAGDRPYPKTILFDLLDFLLGAGWIIVLPVLFCLLSRRRWDLQTRLVVLCLAQPILVAVIGILQSETARAWNFMLPLLLLPAAIEMSSWPRWARVMTYLSMLALMLVIGHNMVFMLP